MARPPEAARFLVHHMLSTMKSRPGIHVFVTHDSLVTATAAQVLGVRIEPDEWPWYLEGAFFWSKGDKLSGAYRQYENEGITTPLCGLTEAHIIEFARREIAATVGLESSVRFFLAGGAFKTLLSGRPPRDLDFWAPSQRDRDLLSRRLFDRGARASDSTAFAAAFTLHGRIIEVPHKVEPPTLEERLGHFDIALSAVGVEHGSDGTWRAVIHPLAHESVRQRRVLLLKPLVNWKYALTTLERMRRYADELNFESPREEEEEVWRVISQQPAEIRSGLIDRYKRTGTGSYGVWAEISCRFQ